MLLAMLGSGFQNFMGAGVGPEALARADWGLYFQSPKQASNQKVAAGNRVFGISEGAKSRTGKTTKTHFNMKGLPRVGMRFLAFWRCELRLADGSAAPASAGTRSRGSKFGSVFGSNSGARF